MNYIEQEIIFERESSTQRGIDNNRVSLHKTTYGDKETNLHMAWGIVEQESADSELGTVDVILQSGIILRNVEILTREWAGMGYGERDLPPKDSKVLIAFPEGIIENAIIIGSVLSVLGSVGEKQSEELLVAGKEREELIITEAGWKRTYNKDSGDISFVKNTISISVKGDASEIKITDGTNTFLMDSSGITLNDNLLVEV